MLYARVSAVCTLALVSACVARLSETDRACPCAEGWSCCESSNVCVLARTLCPGDIAPPLPRLSGKVVIETPRVVAQSSGAAQVQPGQVLWTGESWAVLYREDKAGRLAIWLRLFRPSVAPSAPIEVYSAPSTTDDFPRSAMIAWTGTDFGVFWTTRGRMFFRGLSSTGIASAPARPIFSIGFHGFFRTVLYRPASQQYVLVWVDDRVDKYHDQIYVAHTTAEGTLVGDQQTPIVGYDNVRTAGLVQAGSESLLLWGLATPGDPGRIYLTRLDTEGRLIAAPARIHEGREARFSSPALAQDGARTLVSLWDLERGLVLTRVGLDDVPRVLGGPAPTSPPQIATTGAGLHALVHGEGVISATDSRPTRIAVRFLDRQVEQATLSATVATVADGRWIEAHDIARGPGDTFALLWLEGSTSGGTLYLATASLQH